MIKSTMTENHKEAIVTWGSLIASATIAFAMVGAATAILNWQYTESNKNRSDITTLQIEVAKNQVTKPEFQQSIKELKAEFKQNTQDLSERFDRGLDRIEKRLEAQRVK